MNAEGVVNYELQGGSPPGWPDPASEKELLFLTLP